MGRKKQNIWKRIEDKILKKGECHCWIGACFGSGSPCVSYDGRPVLVSRLIMYLKEEDFPLDSPLLVLHKQECHYKTKCVRYEHLYIGTQWQNMQDKIEERLR